MKTLEIRWQRLLDAQGRTCDRCGATEQAVRQAAADLEQALHVLGIEVQLKVHQLDPARFAQAPLESNRLWIADAPLEHWLGASSGQSRCCSACGDSDCRTLQLGEQVYEAIPAELILRAGLLAAASLLDDRPSACCPSEPQAAVDTGCCSRTEPAGP